MKKNYLNEIAKLWGWVSSIGFGLIFVIYLVGVVGTLEPIETFNTMWGFIKDDAAAFLRIVFFLSYVISAIIGAVTTHENNKNKRSW